MRNERWYLRTHFWFVFVEGSQFGFRACRARAFVSARVRALRRSVGGREINGSGQIRASGEACRHRLHSATRESVGMRREAWDRCAKQRCMHSSPRAESASERFINLACIHAYGAQHARGSHTNVVPGHAPRD